MKPQLNPAVIVICLFVLTATNIFSQQAENKPSIPTDSGYIDVDGGKLYYEIAGAGDYVVLLHDGILHRVVWDEQFPVLAKKYRVVRYDRRGFGRSSAPHAPFSHVDDLNQLFTQLKIPRATIFGMSAGGGIAIDFTLMHPDKVNALILAGAIVSGYGYSSHMLTRGGHIASIGEYLEPKKFIRYFGWEDPYEIYPENIKAKEKFLKLLEANPQNVDGALSRFEKPQERPAVKFLSEIKVPALILVGEYDIPDVHAHAGVIEAGIPDAKREIISKAGHLIPLEQPAAFQASVQRFLNRMEFHKVLNSQGVNAAVTLFLTNRRNEPGPIMDENEMNRLGYRFLQDGKIKDAIELFKLNTIAYPNSGNAFDSLGEAYLKDGQNELAIKNYEKSLELNPDNTNAKEFLTALQKSSGQASSDPKLLKEPESIVYDKSHERYLLSNYSTGNIVQVDGNGKQTLLVENQNAIQGLEIVGNVVYVGARNSVRGFDLETGEMVMNVSVEGVTNLNDVTADDAGNLYAGDVFGTKIIKIRIADSSYSVFVDGQGIDHPNGIFYDRANNRILVCSYRKNSPIQSISLADSAVTTLANTSISECDGIVLDKYGRCYVTSWETLSIYRFDKDFSNPPTVFYKSRCGPADISYDRAHDAIAVPLMSCNSFEIVPVDPPQGKQEKKAGSRADAGIIK
jgi:3-oxoadipate enol-lactonase